MTVLPFMSLSLQPNSLQPSNSHQNIISITFDPLMDKSVHDIYVFCIQGGVKFQLLEADGTVKTELSDSEFILSDDST